MNKYDVYNWIVKVIASCETAQQSTSVGRLIDNFQKMFGDCKLTGNLLQIDVFESLDRMNKIQEIEYES